MAAHNVGVCARGALGLQMQQLLPTGMRWCGCAPLVAQLNLMLQR